MAMFVALLRGINVGGNKQVKMAALKALCEAAGYADVRTLLQSGNVVLSAKDGKPAAVAATLARAIEAHFGFSVDVVVRTPVEMAAIVEGNPFADAAANDPSHLVVMFLDRDPGEEAVARVAAGHAGPETIAAGDRAVYIHYPDGIGRSKLTNVELEKRLGAVGTGRNWNTVTKLLAMTETT